MKGGDFRQAIPKRGDGSLGTRLGGKPDACWKSWIGGFLALGGKIAQEVGF